mmetsp:Transcript_2334/g.3657  ORF Transcript_2334/g.3657 Transcript_2334/m.3657 type:complete len:209 (-) Transcript_2334:264-890(-)
MCQPSNKPQHTAIAIDEPTQKKVRFVPPADSMERVREVTAPVVVVKVKSLWYSSNEFAEFRDSARDSCEHCNGIAASLDRNPFVTKDCNHQGMMNYWSRHGQSVRGLESFANPHLGQARRRQRARYLKSVILAQTIAREEQQQSSSSGRKDMDVVKFLAFFASKESRTAKKYARMLGKADENAVDYRAKPVRNKTNQLHHQCTHTNLG